MTRTIPISELLPKKREIFVPAPAAKTSSPVTTPSSSKKTSPPTSPQQNSTLHKNHLKKHETESFKRDKKKYTDEEEELEEEDNKSMSWAADDQDMDRMNELLGDLDLDAQTEVSTEDSDSEGKPLPAHACTYCAWSNVEHVVKCTGCDKWFCNGKTPGAPASHIVHHLVRSKHKEIVLHPESSSGDSIAECYQCGNKNIFTLGFVPDRDESMVILLCRAPCANEAGKDGDWDPTRWMPLIESKSLLSWFVSQPTEDDMRLVPVPITPKEMLRLEDAWKKDSKITLNDLSRMDAMEAALLPLPARFEDPQHYLSQFQPLVDLEADYDRKAKEAQSLTNVTVRWETGLNNRIFAWFYLTSITNSTSDMRPTAGDEVCISFPGKWKGIGNIVEVNTILSEEIAVELSPISAKSAPTDLVNGFSVEFVWKSTSFDRMKLALRKFANCHVFGGKTPSSQDIDPLLANAILGNLTDMDIPVLPIDLPNDMSIPGLSPPNPSQVHAIRTALTRPLSLIQGPPGTGKTVTSALIVWHLINTCKHPLVLVIAPSNVAADHLTEKIHQTGLRVLRVAARCREHTLDAGPVDFLTLHQQIKHYTIRPQLQKLLQLKQETGYLSDKDQAALITLKKRAEKDLLCAAQVVVATCSGSGDNRLVGMRFPAVLLDEAAQACEPESLIPLMKGARQVVLVGDHRQLGPVILDKKAAKACYGRSLFERLIQTGMKPIRLQVQYRMHPCLSEWPSNAFYEGTLQNGISAMERTRSALDFPWFNTSLPMMFINCTGSEELSSSGTSFLNRMEASYVEKIVTRFLKASVLPSQIGVITPYDGQRVYVQQTMQMSGILRKELYSCIEIASVDAFQGREKDYVVLTCVRSNDHQGIGFLSDPRRLNVALTRAKYGLVILGNARVLGKNELWNRLLLHFKAHELLVEGPLTGLKQSMVQLPLPKPTAPTFVTPTSPTTLAPSHIPATAKYSNAISPPSAGMKTLHSLTFGTVTPESIFVMNDFFSRNNSKQRSVSNNDDDERLSQTTFDTQL
jgi:regulator of nonsense transcripts 1